jgi:hypothetical protein
MEKFNDFKKMLEDNIKNKDEYYYYTPCQQINYIINLGLMSEDIIQSDDFKEFEKDNYNKLDMVIDKYDKDELRLMF